MLGRLIEIAIHIRDFDGIDHYFDRLAQLPPTEVEAATAYFRAKYLYNVAVPFDQVAQPDAPLPQPDPQKLEAARLAFEAVSDRSPYYAQARYFVGVIYTLRGQYSQAIDAFQRVLPLAATTGACTTRPTSSKPRSTRTSRCHAPHGTSTPRSTRSRGPTFGRAIRRVRSAR